jgi:hypothetical protein
LLIFPLEVLLSELFLTEFSFLELLSLLLSVIIFSFETSLPLCLRLRSLSFSGTIFLFDSSFLLDCFLDDLEFSFELEILIVLSK